MAAALELYLDGAASRRVRALWDALEAAGVPTLRELTHRRHKPHISLAVAQRLDPAKVEAALTGVPMCPPLPVRLDYAGQFVGRVLWLGPTPTAELLAYHATVHHRLAAAGVEVDPLYHPGVWVPHCTVSMRVPRPLIAEAVRLCLEVLPIPATLTGAAVADHNRGEYHPLPAGS
ncbi:MAG TPA: 2'-5' RNA ligase family protein [Natronosporangium sp.]